MNDRFRFRACVVGHYFSKNDEEKEILIKLNDVTVYNDGTIGIDYHSLIKSVCNLLTNENERESLIEYFEDKNCTTGDDWYYLEAKFIEQCTGLKDKNGRLIYEGDIVNILCEIEEQGVIEWATEEAQFVVSAEQAGFVANFDNYRGSDLEVIGNIHENADLLEDK